jgi:hypothetical protein
MGDTLGRPSYVAMVVRRVTSTLPRFDPTKYGVADYSFYEGLIDFNLAKTNGVQRPVIRVGQGYYGLDTQFKNSSVSSKGVFPVRDFYWMLDTKQSANGQANTCANALKTYGNLDSDSILWADFELAPANASFLWGFISTLKSLMPGLKIGIYTGYSYWQTYGSTSATYGFSQYPLWIAWPVDPYQEPAPLAPWTTYYYHQWTFAGDGKFYGCQSLGVDLDYLNPIYVNPVPPPPPPVVTGTAATYTVIGSPASRVRSDPSFGDNVVANILPGSTVYGEMTPDNLWLKVEGYMYNTVVTGTVTTPTPPPPPPPSNLGLYRVLTDGELPPSYDYGGKSRTAQPGWDGNAMTPATVKLHGVNDPISNFSPEAATLVQTLDTPHGTFNYVTRTSAGWANAGQTWPDKMEPIVFEGSPSLPNYVDVIAVDGNKAYIRTWHGETDPTTDAGKAVIHRWTNIDQNNNLHGTTNPAGDGIGYIVLDYGNDGAPWIELDRLVKV